jgi:hypothetical protein
MAAAICRAAARTGTVLTAQLIHVSSAGSLVMFGPSRVTPGQEAAWYAVYGGLLWLVAPWMLGRSWPLIARVDV